MKETEKSPGIESLLKTLAGKYRPETIRSGDCMLCENPDTNFRDSLSVREYQISGMCQRCQDNFNFD